MGKPIWIGLMGPKLGQTKTLAIMVGIVFSLSHAQPIQSMNVFHLILAVLLNYKSTRMWALENWLAYTTWFAGCHPKLMPTLVWKHCSFWSRKDHRLLSLCVPYRPCLESQRLQPSRPAMWRTSAGNGKMHRLWGWWRLDGTGSLSPPRFDLMQMRTNPWSSVSRMRSTTSMFLSPCFVVWQCRRTTHCLRWKPLPGRSFVGDKR